MIATSANSAKYLFKYMMKGADHISYYLRCWRDNMETAGNAVPDEPDHAHDEPAQYVNARWMGSTEAAWRLLGFPLFGKSHSIARLQFHLQDEQSVTWDEANMETARRALIRERSTPLTAFFAVARAEVLAIRTGAMQHDNSRRYAFELRYIDMPLHYTWHSNRCTWTPHRQRPHRRLARMYFASPIQGHLYMST